MDVMPIDTQIIGFSNRWYSQALATVQQYWIATDMEIRLVRPRYFIATKIEAFSGRGYSGFYGSRDLEDIVTVLDGWTEISVKIAQVAP